HARGGGFLAVVVPGVGAVAVEDAELVPDPAEGAVHRDANVVPDVAERIEHLVLLAEDGIAVEVGEELAAIGAAYRLEGLRKTPDPDPPLDRGDLRRAGQLDQAEGLLELADPELEARIEAEIDPGVLERKLPEREVGLELAGDPVIDLGLEAEADAAGLEDRERDLVIEIGGDVVLVDARGVVLDLDPAGEPEVDGPGLDGLRGQGGRHGEADEEDRGTAVTHVRPVCDGDSRLPRFTIASLPSFPDHGPVTAL